MAIEAVFAAFAGFGGKDPALMDSAAFAKLGRDGRRRRNAD